MKESRRSSESLAPPAPRCPLFKFGAAAQAAIGPHSEAQDTGRHSQSHVERNQTSPKSYYAANAESTNLTMPLILDQHNLILGTQ